jgi:L-threonylcarbamoyladenylate synthase
MTAGPLPHKIKVAAQLLAAGGVIAYPTEAVWGLGCDPHNRQAVLRLLALKRRRVDRGLILVANSVRQFAPYLQGLDAGQLAVMDSSRAGPTTWVVPDNHYAPDWVRGRFQSIALRVSAHPIVVQLCDAFGGPIVSTSANLAGRPPCKWPWQIQRHWGSQLDWIVHGELGGSSSPSEIRDLLTDSVLRQA